ncbi:MAG: energy transducer TonB [Acidobacteriota bacterium]
MRGSFVQISVSLVFIACVVVVPAKATAAGETLRTHFQFLAGSPAEGGQAKGAVLILPGTVVVPGTSRTTDSHPPLKLMNQLREAYRLSQLTIMSSYDSVLKVGAEDRVGTGRSGPDIHVTLLGFDDRNALYKVRMTDAGKPLAEPKVAIQRGERGIVGGRNGVAAPYFFVVIEPYGTNERGADGAWNPPKLVHRVEPEYPAEAADAKVQGVVILSATLGTDGSVREIKVVQGQPSGLTEAAKAAVSQWKYEPARDAQGKPVEVEFDVTVSFILE